MENWPGSSLNQIQGWTTVRESYSRVLEQGPLNLANHFYTTLYMEILAVSKMTPKFFFAGCAHVADDRVQRGGGGVEEHPLHHVGPRRPGLAQGRVEHILLQHRG